MKKLFRPKSFEDLQLAGLIIGILWIGPRVYAAIISSSVGIMADTVEHVVETAFAFMAFLALRAARRSSALLFPHGTGKFESIATAMLALSLSISGFGVLAAGIVRFINPVVPEGSMTGIVFLCISLCLDLILYNLTRPFDRDGRIVVRSWRRIYLMNIVMKLSIIIFVYLSQFGGALTYLDPLAAVIIGIVMLGFGYRALTQSIWELSDRAIEEDVQLLILRGLAKEFSSFDELIDVRTRRTGGLPIIEVDLGFRLTRPWDDVAMVCLRLRESVSAEISGAVVKVTPLALNSDLAALTDQKSNP